MSGSICPISWPVSLQQAPLLHPHGLISVGTAVDATYLVSMEALNEKGFWGFFRKMYHLFRVMPAFISFMRTNNASTVTPRVTSFLKGVRSDETTKSLPVATAGFCWGGYYTVQLCHDTEKTDDGRPLQDCGFTAHPSNLAVPADIEKVKLPLSVAIGSEDIVLPLNKSQIVEKTLEGLTKKNQGEHEFVLYEGAHHGFAVRGSDTDAKESQQGLDAEEQALKWFNKWFS
jgi:dienelactone hydrolase